MRRVRVTTRRSNSIVRKGAVVEIEWTPDVRELVDDGRLTLIDPPPRADSARDTARDTAKEPTDTNGGSLADLPKAALTARAIARGLHVPSSWSKSRIIEALEEVG